MKIPYGLSNFKKVIIKDNVYIDKTAFIEELEEQGDYNILLRPRRFGKSLFLSSLWYYYDIRYKSDFDTLFAGLYIGKNPTPKKSSYKVLFMDFSGLNTDNYKTILQSFKTRVDVHLRTFLKTYHYSRDDIDQVVSSMDPADKMSNFFEIIREEKIYILIDEYDHFANSILGDDLELFQQVLGRGGFVRSFYETIKTATMSGVVDRFFITGVTSITLDSMTSGFNIGDNISRSLKFNNAIGFTSEEVSTLVQPLVDLCDLDKGKLVKELSSWYNGYCFNHESVELLYNSDMLLYFLHNFNEKTCRYPERMLDDNILSDYRKILQFFAIGDIERNYKVLEELIIDGEVVATLKGKLDIVKEFSRDDFISLLFYMGFITISGMDIADTCFRIPNHVIKQLYFEYFKVELEQRGNIKFNSHALREVIRELLLHNNPTPFTTELAKVLSLLSNRDYMNMDEKHIKTIILTLLYQSTAYFIKSEPEINNKYPDILLLERSPFEINHQFLFELKYSKKQSGKKGWEAKKKDGIKQVKGYLELADIKEIAKLKSYLIITNGSEIETIAIEKTSC